MSVSFFLPKAGMMYNAARTGDRSVMIFLAKNELGYKDNTDMVVSDTDKAMVIVDV